MCSSDLGMGANIFRGHDNVQGATDVGLDIMTLPFQYGLTEGAWKHWSRVWEVHYNYLVDRFDDKKMMETPGIPLTRPRARRIGPRASSGTSRPFADRRQDHYAAVV